MDINKIRNDFPVFREEPGLAYLDSAAMALKPKAVIDAVDNYYRNYGCNVHRGVYRLSYLATDKYELSQYAYAVKLNSDFDEPNHRGSYNVQKVTYSEAYNIARAQNAHLATVASKEENEVLKNMFKKFGYHGAWLGGTDKGHEGIWTWVTGESFGFNEWASGEPNNDGAEDYLGFTDSGYKWNDFKDESDVRSFFIEF